MTRRRPVRARAAAAAQPARAAHHWPATQPVQPAVGDKPGLTFFVDGATGSDANPGTSAKPWRTIAFAADEAASAAQKHEAPIAVSVAAGIYTEPLFFGPAQSGRPSATITFRGVAGAVISGGLTIPKTAFRPSTAGPRGMLTVDLGELGVNITDLGSLAPGTLGECSGDQIELVEDGAVMTLARLSTPSAPSQRSTRCTSSSACELRNQRAIHT
eukprot:COSAG02_NODE_21525_length_784_cov_4.325547_1_plen_214_part_01